MKLYFYQSGVIAPGTKMETVTPCEWELIIENDQYPETPLGVYFKKFVAKPTKRQIRKAKREARKDFDSAYIDYIVKCNSMN